MENWKNLGFKYKLQYFFCFVAFILSGVFSFMGLLIPPPGVVDGSVLGLIGIWLGFCGSVLGISTHYSIEFEKLSQLIKKEKQEG